MSERRFVFIRNHFRIEDFEKGNTADKLYSVRYFIEYQFEKWRKNFTPGRDLCIDETIIPYYSRNHKLVVGIRNKPNLLAF